MVQIFLEPPPTFSSAASVAACYLEYEGKLLLLRRATGTNQGGFWGVPAGKIELGETPIEAAVRELAEETNITINSNALQELGTLYIRKPTIDYIFHMFRLTLSSKPHVALNCENDEYQWVAPHELETLPLMPGAKSTYLRYCQALPSTKNRTTASVSTYLILQKNDEILLGLRKNTGYCDGMWSLPAGHVENGESASAGMIREAKEELGIDLNPKDLKVIHTMHRQSNRINIDIFFHCTTWRGTIENMELEKCEKLSFFPLNALPENFVPYNRNVLDCFHQNIFFSESGWE